MAAKLEGALTGAGVTFRTETYPAEHGWMMPDFPVYDREAAERGWSELRAMYQRTPPLTFGAAVGRLLEGRHVHPRHDRQQRP